MPNGNDITQETWEKMSPEERDWLMIDFLQGIHKRVLCLESRKWLHNSLAFLGGIAGGVLAVLTCGKALLK